MLSDKFFEAYAATASKPPDTGSDPEPAPKTYTAAEVDELVNKKVAEAVASIQARLAEAEDLTTEPDTEPAE